MNLFAFTLILSCGQINSILNRLDQASGLTSLQKKDIVEELRKVIPSCPIQFKNYDTKRQKASQGFGFDDVGPSNDLYRKSNRSQEYKL